MNGAASLHSCIDEAVLRENGQTDFSMCSTPAANRPPDVFL